ncbi:hypothetical protein [Gemmobacter denitrificans]|uniref:Uncharacterized protein n=1 Tax=Gemmobacter denitrificans TaxID=3123040 RepID=A0ABU8BQ49_9RHOB
MSSGWFLAPPAFQLTKAAAAGLMVLLSVGDGVVLVMETSCHAKLT